MIWYFCHLIHLWLWQTAFTFDNFRTTCHLKIKKWFPFHFLSRSLQSKMWGKWILSQFYLNCNSNYLSNCWSRTWDDDKTIGDYWLQAWIYKVSKLTSATHLHPAHFWFKYFIYWEVSAIRCSRWQYIRRNSCKDIVWQCLILFNVLTLFLQESSGTQ